jgi:hypothetical protein
MHWAKLIELSADSRIFRYSRMTSNWYRAHSHLNQQSISTVIHRIGAKRVVLEIPKGASKPRGTGRYRKLLVAAGLATCLPLFAMFAHSNYSPGTQQEIVASKSVAAACGDFYTRERFTIAELGEFRVGDWLVKTYGARLDIGAISSIRFEAECNEEVVLGTMKLARIESGFEILQMTQI